MAGLTLRIRDSPQQIRRGKGSDAMPLTPCVSPRRGEGADRAGDGGSGGYKQPPLVREYEAVTVS